MKAKHVLITAFFWIVLGASVQGQTIGWNFGTSSGTASPNVTTANVTSSNVAQGNNNGTTTMLDKSQESKDYPGASGKFNAGAAARRGALNIGASGSAYFEFTLTPASGYAVTLTAISFGSKSKDKGPQAYTLRTSLDNYGSDKASGTLSNNDKWALHSNASLSVASAASTPITFRIYGYAGDRDTGEDEAIWRIDDLMLSVTASRVIPAPTITSFSPTSGGVGASVTITGTNFTGTTSVKFNGTNQPTFTVVSPTSITATVPTGATTGPISVTTASGTATSGTSFTVIPAPTITSFSPTSGGIGASVTITGTNLTGATSVKFNSTSQPTYTVVNPTSITTTVPAGATTGPISVTTAGGTATSGTSFTVIPAPTITSFSPTSGGIGASVTITGTNFTGTTSVMFNGTNQPTFTVVSSTSITATVPTGATTGPISITTAGGTATSGTSFTVIPAPTITSFSPTSGGIGASVTIIGTNFTGTTSVKFNGTNQPTFTVVDPTSITTTVPAGATTGPISVTTAGGTATSGTSFTVIPAPTITSFSPTSGEIGAGVTIDGTDLSGATSVTFNGTSATILTNTALQITTTVPAGATTGAISVTTPGGTATSSSNFTVAPQKTTTQMNEGWNLVSVPRVPVDSSTSVLFPNAVPGSVNSYLTESYTQPAKLNTGEGYWALYSAADSNTISGTAITSASITVSTGNRWVLIGSVTESIAATGLVSNPPDAIVPNTLYGWDGSTYFAASSLLPGKGYWVLVNAPCTLTVSSPPPAATSVKSVSGISRPSIKDTNKVEKRALSPGGN